MAYIVKHNDDYVSMAYDLAKLKSNDDDIKAADDLYVLDTILNGVRTCVNIYLLDERLRREYKTIEMLENVQENFCYNDGISANRMITERERMISRLKSDRAGVIADVLIKHAKIKCVDELYEKIA